MNDRSDGRFLLIIRSVLQFKWHICSFFLFTILTYLMVYLPCNPNLFKTYIGGGEVVMWSNYFWWFDYAITYLHINPLHDSYLYYPMGMDFIEGGILPILLFVPITHILGSVASYNIYLLSTFVLSGFGMFLLVDYLLNDKKIAFIAGLIFAFCPFHFAASLGHLHTFSIMLLPFFVLYMHKMFDTSSIRNVIICSFFFACTALTSWTIGLMASLFFATYLFINSKIINKTYSKSNLVLFVVISLILMSPGLYYILKNIINNKFLFFPLDNFIRYSADLFGFIIPSPLHPFFKSFTLPIYSHFTSNYSENIVFIGYTVLFLSVIGLLYCGKTKKILPYIVTLIISFLFSLGPLLQINGSKISNLYLPGILPYFIPFLNINRVPSRYDILIMFCLSIIAAYGIKYLFNRYQTKKAYQIASCLIIGFLILFEFLTVMPTQDVVTTPSFYYSISTDKGNYSIMDIPAEQSSIMLSGGGLRYYDEYQKIHHKMVIGGYGTKTYYLYEQTVVQNDPVLLYLYYLNMNQKPEDMDPLEHLHQKFSVQYLIIHSKFIDNNNLDKLLTYLGKTYTLDNSVEQDPLIIYRCDIIPQKMIKLKDI
jgi:hypothetical protein